ncbi:MAG: IS200/IS605 family element transposase accessory protein TnpB [Candidatus Lokiarchaeota archaeon]|nr:IS200/IS605 family element transposase accessory protein TnpB [Candidatus Lokiarchaeota archaeon]
MKQTIKFRLHPTASQEQKLHEIFTIYNKIKRIGYNHYFKLKHTNFTKNEKRLFVQHHLMELCHNNPYVNSILINCETKLAQQHTWFEKREKYLKHQIITISKKIKQVKEKNKKDRRLKGLYSHLSSVQNNLFALRFKPIVFGTKKLLRERILGKISRDEYRIRRDSSFCCVGKKQGVNLNLKILPNMTLKVHTFSKEKTKKWFLIPFTVNYKQEQWFEEILDLELYQVEVVRRLIRGGIRYFIHVSYEIPEEELKYGFENGTVGLDMNYNFVSLCNINKAGSFKSFHEIKFRNLHSYRKNKRNDYISYKMDKVVNYCINKQVGIVIEDLSFEQDFSYGRKRNRKLNNFKTSALSLLERKCLKRGVAVRKVHPAYTSLIGKYKYSYSRNLSTHILASYVIARKSLGFKELIPPIYKWLLAQVGDAIKPRLKPSSPYYNWAKLHDFFKHCGITSFKTSEVMKKTLQMKYVLNSVTSEQPDNLRAGLSSMGKVDDWHKFWNCIEITNIL